MISLIKSYSNFQGSAGRRQLEPSQAHSRWSSHADRYGARWIQNSTGDERRKLLSEACVHRAQQSNKIKKNRVHFFKEKQPKYANEQLSWWLGTGGIPDNYLHHKVNNIKFQFKTHLLFQALNFLFRNMTSNHSNEIRASSPSFTILFFPVSLKCAPLRSVYCHFLSINYYFSSNSASMAWQFW